MTRVVARSGIARHCDCRQREQLAEKPPAALQACKRLMRSSTREQLERAVKLENEEFSSASDLPKPRKRSPHSSRNVSRTSTPSRNQKHAPLKIF